MPSKVRNIHRKLTTDFDIFWITMLSQDIFINKIVNANNKCML